MQLNKTALGLAAGIAWGACVFLATLWVAIRGGGEHLILLSQFYLGYSVTVVGAFVGLIWGFIDGFVSGWVFAWLYNLFAKEKSAAPAQTAAPAASPPTASPQ